MLHPFLCSVTASLLDAQSFFFFFCKSCHFSLSHQLFRTKGESLRFLFFFVSSCFLAFFQHHIAVVWREHLLKVFQKFEKIEADATLSTLVEFSILGQAIRFASLGSVKFAVTVSYGLLLAVSHSFHSLHHFFLILPVFLSFSTTQIVSFLGPKLFSYSILLAFFTVSQ